MIWWLEHGAPSVRVEAHAYVLMATANALLGPDEKTT